jgi:hypothetical protein
VGRIMRQLLFSNSLAVRVLGGHVRSRTDTLDLSFKEQSQVVLVPWGVRRELDA